MHLPLPIIEKLFAIIDNLTSPEGKKEAYKRWLERKTMRALDAAEQYIFTNEELFQYLKVKENIEDKRKVKLLKRRLRDLKKRFFKYN